MSETETVAEILGDDEDCLYCRHCGGPGRYARGLCHKCWSDKALMELYEPMTYRQRAKCRGVGLLNREPAVAKEPTRHAPGSAGKLEVLCERARAGVALWHPLDSKGDLR